MVKTMRFSSFFILAFLVGCSKVPDATGNSDGGNMNVHSPVFSDAPGTGSDDPCSNAAQFVKVNDLDGGFTFVEVPNLCDPYWHDVGDPPPDVECRQVIDPGPVDSVDGAKE
jgi:hypothetical protein